MTVAFEELLVAPRPAPAVTVAAAPPRTLVEIFASTVTRAPGNVAVETCERAYTYAELVAAADELAGRLRAVGVGPGDRVGVRIASGSAELYVAILGVLQAGAAYAAVDADDPSTRADDAWRAASVCAVIGDGLTIGERFAGSGAGRSLRVDDDAWVIFTSGSTICTAGGPWLMAAAAPIVIAAAGLSAVGLTVGAKWLVIGRYRRSERPFWSFFVWRDEIINSCQEQLAGIWLLNYALATPLMSAYLRAMGAKVGRSMWCETLNITEFDLVDFGEGCAINRRAHIETHLVHDRLMRLGPTRLGPGSTLGPSSAVLPDTTLGAGCSVGGRSVVMRGEQLPARTRWHGAPVIAA